MKKLVIVICSALSLIVTSCSKSKDTLKPSGLITGRVVEYGSGLPIAEVQFSYNLCVRPAFLGCDDYNSGKGITNPDGLITIPQESISGTGSFDNYTFGKDGYWRNGKTPLFSPFDYGADIPAISYFRDTFKVQLFPVVNVSVQAKNTAINPADTIFYLQCQARCCPGFVGRDGNLVSLRSGIDTTFDYPVFGNVENYLYVVKSTSAATDTVFAHSQFIARANSINLEVLYNFSRLIFF